MNIKGIITLKKTAIIIFIAIYVVFLLFSTSVFAAGTNELLWNNEAEQVQQNTGLGNRAPTGILANIMNIILGFVGFLAVVIVIYGGFKWMTAAGNNDQVEEAKKIIIAGIIGIIIIISAFSISAFVINQLWNVTGGN